MLAKVLIKRQFKPGHTQEIVALLNDMRSAAMGLPGYLSGLTLMEPENPSKMLVISTWQTLEDWNNWKSNGQRIHLESLLEVYQNVPTQYEAYVVGTGFSQ